MANATTNGTAAAFTDEELTMLAWPPMYGPSRCGVAPSGLLGAAADSVA